MEGIKNNLLNWLDYVNTDSSETADAISVNKDNIIY